MLEPLSGRPSPVTPEVCLVCGSAQLAILYPQAEDYLTGDGFQVWQCQHCGTGFTFPQKADLSRYYPSRYRQYTPFIVNILKGLYRRKVHLWIRDFTAPGRVFEMGCGSGFMLDTLRQAGWQVVGSERSPEALTYARQTLGLNVFVGAPNALSGAVFDLVILFQVLEHLHNPVETLAQIRRLLKPGGKVVIGVPNLHSWQAAFGRDRWFHLDVPRHLFHFSPDALRIALEKAGLQVETIRYNSFEHDPYGWVQTGFNRLDPVFNRLTRFLMRIDRTTGRSLVQLVVAFPVGIIAGILTVFSWIFKRGAIMEITARRLE
ncbi:MAG TPA: class I SAM-dependent methyltransferase [Phototrophicaceae bacterium]|nr:class I SAM-dependent methyltransferase [Phototrophicaceae bacterium]